MGAEKSVVGISGFAESLTPLQPTTETFFAFFGHAQANTSLAFNTPQPAGPNIDVDALRPTQAIIDYPVQPELTPQ